MNISKQTNDYGIKLLAINLPTFDENYLNWRSFEDSFSAFVDQNNSLTNVPKLCYLRSQLKGDAWNLIKSLETTEENDNIAFNLVKERFNNHRLIVLSHVNAILNSKFENAKSFINTIDQHVQDLQRLNVSLKNYHGMLILLLVPKLDNKFIHD